MPDGRFMPLVMPPGWGPRDAHWHEPLVPSAPGAPPRDDVPWVVYTMVQDGSASFLPADIFHGEMAASSRERALQNLAAEQVRLHHVGRPPVELWVADGGFFTAEKVLDRAFVRGVLDRLGAPMLAAGMPVRGLLYMADAGNPLAVQGLAAAVNGKFDEAGEQALTRTLVVVSEAGPVGVLEAAPAGDAGQAGRRPAGRPADPEVTWRKRSFWDRLLGR